VDLKHIREELAQELEELETLRSEESFQVPQHPPEFSNAPCRLPHGVRRSYPTVPYSTLQYLTHGVTYPDLAI
jgi:hypothetical protein